MPRDFSAAMDETKKSAGLKVMDQVTLLLAVDLVNLAGSAVDVAGLML